MNSQIEMNEAILVAYIDGTLSPEQMAQVEHWYDASEDNRKLFEQLYFILQLHDRTQSVKGISAEQSLAALKQKIAARNAQHSNKRVITFGRRALRYAVVCVLLAAVTGFIAYFFYDKNQQCVVVADNEQQKTIVLPDQSTVVLKGDSKISFSTKFADKRVVYLDGEALFDVVKVADSEFVVKTSDAQIVVKGTKFNFKAYSNSKLIETTLLEGAIDLRTSGHKIAIKPNQKAV